MKVFLIIIFMMVVASLKAQERLTGSYKDSFGNKMIINSDSTFEHQWSFDMQSSWARGTWSKKRDTVFFAMVPVYDTVQVCSGNEKYKDSLVLSLDPISERTILRTDVLYGYGQNYHPYPEKLVYKRNKLYPLKSDGSLRQGRVKGWTNKKLPVWFTKLNEPD